MYLFVKKIINLGPPSLKGLNRWPNKNRDLKIPARIQNKSIPQDRTERERERERDGEDERRREAIDAENRENPRRSSSFQRHPHPQAQGALGPPFQNDVVVSIVPFPVLLCLLQNPSPSLRLPEARGFLRAHCPLRLCIYYNT